MDEIRNTEKVILHRIHLLKNTALGLRGRGAYEQKIFAFMYLSLRVPTMVGAFIQCMRQDLGLVEPQTPHMTLLDLPATAKNDNKEIFVGIGVKTVCVYGWDEADTLCTVTSHPVVYKPIVDFKLRGSKSGKIGK